MFRSIIAMGLAVFMTALLTQEANARRTRIPMPFPYLSETIVKVADLPDIAPLKRKDGNYIDLGYKFNMTSGGEWVGYFGSSSTFVPLTKAQLDTLMLVGGMTKLPPVPSRPWINDSPAGWVFKVLFGLLALAMLKKLLFRKSKSTGYQRKNVPTNEDAINAAIATAKAETAQVTATPTSYSGAPAANATFGRAAPSFGQRVS